MLYGTLDAVEYWDCVKVIFSVVVCLSVQEVSVKTKKKKWCSLWLLLRCYCIVIFDSWASQPWNERVFEQVTLCCRGVYLLVANKLCKLLVASIV